MLINIITRYNLLATSSRVNFVLKILCSFKHQKLFDLLNYLLQSE
jgi:hypothetical protein